jgi:signal transduction histidine kinase
MNEARLLLLAAAVALLAAIAALSYSLGKRRAEAKLYSRQRQLADLTHELRTPLTVIESYASMIKRWAGQDPKLREEATEVILSEAARLRHLAARLLSRSAAAGRAAEDPITPLNLTVQLRETAERLSVAFGRTILVQSEDRPAVITGHAQELRQLWVILLDNAIKYSREAIDIGLNESAHSVFVTIRDRGIGIPPYEMPYLFKRRYRGRAVRKRRTGAGLGLSIANDIVSRHGGNIQIESKPGAGTTVTVALPK